MTTQGWPKSSRGSESNQRMLYEGGMGPKQYEEEECSEGRSDFPESSVIEQPLLDTSHNLARSVACLEKYLAATDGNGSRKICHVALFHLTYPKGFHAFCRLLETVRQMKARGSEQWEAGQQEPRFPPDKII